MPLVALRDEPPLVRGYLRAMRLRDVVGSRVSATFDAVWLGLLYGDALARVDAHYFQTVRETYGGRDDPYLQPGWNEQGLFDWEREAVAGFFPPSGRVVVTAAGAGREVLALCEAGFDATGYEPNGALRAYGADLLAAHGHPGRLHAMARDAFPAEARECDAVVVGWGSYTNLSSRAVRIAFLDAARRRLPYGGRVLISFFPRREGEWYAAYVARWAGRIRRTLRRPAPEEGDTLQPNFVHRFTRREIGEEAAAAGMTVIHAADAPYGHAVLERGRDGQPAAES